MKPKEFKGHNTVFAKDQPEYQPLPAFYNPAERFGTVVTCWELTWKERFKIFFSGTFWLSQMTFHEPLQPQLPSVDPLITINEN